MSAEEERQWIEDVLRDLGEIARDAAITAAHAGPVFIVLTVLGVDHQVATASSFTIGATKLFGTDNFNKTNYLSRSRQRVVLVIKRRRQSRPAFPCSPGDPECNPC